MYDYSSLGEIPKNKVNNIAGWNLLHGIINLSKRAIFLISHYSPIIPNVWIEKKVNWGLKIFISFWAVYVVPLL